MLFNWPWMFIGAFTAFLLHIITRFASVSRLLQLTCAVSINGINIEYRAVQLHGGTISVSTYYKK